MSFIYNKVINDHRYGQNDCNQKNFAKFTPAQNVGDYLYCRTAVGYGGHVPVFARKDYTPFFPVDNTAYTGK
jgi:hypothetical protein